jgi:hypothetical protein
MAKVHHGNREPATLQMSNVVYDCTQCGEILTVHIQRVECGNSCRECGRYAYRAEQPSYLYLLTHNQLHQHKIGIGTVGKDKGYLLKLIQAGWTTHGLWHAEDEAETFKWEQGVFKHLQIISTENPEPQLFLGRSDKHWVESINGRAIPITELAQLMSTVVSGKVK